MNEKMRQFFYLARLDKPIGIYLLLWPTLWGLWLGGEGRPDLKVVTIFLLGVLVMRSAGCVMNDMADYKLDAFVDRTRLRPLAAKTLSLKEARIFFVTLMLIAFIVVCFTNLQTILLALCGAFFAILYPFLKRITHLPQLGLGIAFSWSIPMAFMALQQTIPTNAWILFLAAIIWPVIYDTQYAMTDRPDDIKIGIKSTAILFGNQDLTMIGILQILFLSLMCFVGYLFHLKIIYFFSLILVGVLFIYQQTLIKERVPTNCFKAFLNNHWVGGLIFLGMVLG